MNDFHEILEANQGQFSKRNIDNILYSLLVKFLIRCYIM